MVLQWNYRQETEMSNHQTSDLLIEEYWLTGKEADNHNSC
jgi:hypothetical protein